MLSEYVSDRSAAVLAAGLLWVMTPNYVLLFRFWAPFDVPAVMFACLALMLLVTVRTGWYPLLAGVATLNRETAIFFGGLVCDLSI